MDFIIGCNYWASNAGTEMWRNWSEEAVREDLEILSSHGVKYMRVFPNWRDFQPIIPILGGHGFVIEYRLEGDRLPENQYWLDEKMLERFSLFCDICAEYGIKLIVGLLTGWMSGRLFIPPALFGKNLYTDSTALLFEQRFIKGMVTRFKDKEAIYAWDLGNECNCMCPVEERHAAQSWTGIIANAIRANDQSHPVVSGMHSLAAEDNGMNWTIKGQAEFCDVLTTHPYPVFVENVYKDNIASLRTLMHGTCETKYYSGLGGRPCLVEEIGTLGPMFCDNDTAADFMRVNLFSNWANGAEGVMWWCANEQINLTTSPYTQKMCEVELGMIDRDRKPKPVLEETKKFGDVLAGFNFKLPKAKQDAVCILTQSQNQWGAAYMSYCLAKQADLNLGFCYGADEIPKSDAYLLPSVCGYDVMPRKNYDELKRRVADGAVLYISNNDGIFADFKELCGVYVHESGEFNDRGTFNLGEEKIEFSRKRRYEIALCGAKALAYDNEGVPIMTEFSYGKGKVYYLNFPLETMLLDENNAFDSNRYKIYEHIFAKQIKTHAAVSKNKYISMTLHPNSDGEVYCVAVNYSSAKREMQLEIDDKYEIDEVLYGSTESVPACDAAVFKLKNKS